MSKSCCALLVVCASSSANQGTRVCVAVSRMTIGAFAADEAPMLVDRLILDFARLNPGTNVMISLPGEKPSPLFSAEVLMCTPLSFAGAILVAMLRRRLVGVPAGTGNASFGHGGRQWWPAG